MRALPVATRAAPWRRALPVLLGLLLSACDRPEECEVGEVEADASTQAPRPDERAATFHFPGNNPMQREFVVVHEDGSYDYAERWNFGVPEKRALQALEERVRANSDSAGREPEASLSDLPIDWDDELQATFGWDWKVGCRMHVCRREGTVCCHQHCKDGGAEGTAYEPPDRFACMNSSAGGRYDWFIEGLRDGGMTELAACS